MIILELIVILGAAFLCNRTTTGLPHRAKLHAGYTRAPTPCRSADWAYSNQTGNCYMFFGEKYTHADAVNECSGLNSELLSIQNQDEQDFIDKVLNYDYEDHWTFGKMGNDGSFKYGTKDIRFLNWLPRNLMTQVAAGEETCIALIKNVFAKGFFFTKTKWDTKSCSQKKSFVCQHQAKRCPALPKAKFVKAHPPKPYIELTINFKCEPGYEMPNYTQRYKDWLGHKPPMNVTKNITEAWEARKPNITSQPSMVYECLYPGKWSAGSLAPCEPISCYPPPDVKHAKRNSSRRVYPSWIHYMCTHGYHWSVDNTSSRISWCGPDKEWIDVPPACEPVECEAFPRVGNASVNSAKNRFKETVVWTCHEGFMYPDMSVRQWVGCRENYVNMQIGRWNISRLDDCITLECPEPPQPANTTHTSNETAHHSIISYSCVSEEFEFPDGEDETQTECGDEALWKPIVPPCTKRAPILALKGKKYSPPAKESPSAETVGTLAMSIMIVLILLMVLLDLGSCYRGLRLMRYNLKRPKRSHAE